MMQRVGWLFVGLVACAPPTLIDETSGVTDEEKDAGENLSRLTVNEALPQLFRRFDGDVALLADLVVALENGEASARTAAGASEEGFFRFQFPEALKGELLGGVTAPPGVDPEAQIRVAVMGDGTPAFPANVTVALEPNQVCIESNSTINYERTYTSTDCTPADFEAGTCTTLASTNEVHKSLQLGSIVIAAGWYDLFKDFRRFELPDGRAAMVARSWIDKPYEGYGGGLFNQTFTLEAWWDNGAGATSRAYAIWVDLDIGLPEDTVKKVVGDSLVEGLERADTFGTPKQTCTQDRNRANTRAQDEAG